MKKNSKIVIEIMKIIWLEKFINYKIGNLKKWFNEYIMKKIMKIREEELEAFLANIKNKEIKINDEQNIDEYMNSLKYMLNK